jgi:hypothetical protein
MKFSRKILSIYIAGLVIVCSNTLAFAAPKAPPQIAFDSFTGTYHLSRDNRGLSLLTTEETIQSDFPANSTFYGITRAIPKEFQGHSLKVKVLNVSDAAGNIVPYKTTTDSQGNLVITTGDPSITLYGFQTIKIRYQTSGVVNLGKKTDQFLLNVNGRGWDQPFGRIDATLFIPKSFKANLSHDPSCYMALNTSVNNNCQIDTEKSSDQIKVTSKAVNVAAHQSLILKLEFKPSTFTNSRAISVKKMALISASLLVIGSVALYFHARKNSA